jgi:cystathionine beta-synthase
MAAEVVGSIDERELLQSLMAGEASLTDELEGHMSPPLPVVGGGESLSALLRALERTDAVVVLAEGRPTGVVTRQDVLGFLAEASR